MKLAASRRAPGVRRRAPVPSIVRRCPILYLPRLKPENFGSTFSASRLILAAFWGRLLASAVLTLSIGRVAQEIEYSKRG